VFKCVLSAIFCTGKYLSIWLVRQHTHHLCYRMNSDSANLSVRSSVSASAPNCPCVVSVLAFVTQSCYAACQCLCVCVCVSKPTPNIKLSVCACLYVTCLCGSNESSVSLAVLPVDIQVWAMRQRYDDIHKTLVTCNQQPCLRYTK